MRCTGRKERWRRGSRAARKGNGTVGGPLRTGEPTVKRSRIRPTRLIWNIGDMEVDLGIWRWSSGSVWSA